VRHAMIGASVINCCSAPDASEYRQTRTKTVDCPNLTFSNNRRSIAGGKISLNVSGRVVNPACIAGVLTSAPILLGESAHRRRQFANFEADIVAVFRGEWLSLANSEFARNRCKAFTESGAVPRCRGTRAT
jgi:hypothetical protein